MQAFVKFKKGMMNMPLPWRLWVLLLVTTNLFIPLFFLGNIEAQFVIGAMLVSMALMTILTHFAGFTRIVGLGHLPWIPLLFFLGAQFSQHPPTDAFGVWLRVLFGLNAISLGIDATDVVRYVVGDREETVGALGPVHS